MVGYFSAEQFELFAWIVRAALQIVGPQVVIDLSQPAQLGIRSGIHRAVMDFSSRTVRQKSSRYEFLFVGLSVCSVCVLVGPVTPNDVFLAPAHLPVAEVSACDKLGFAHQIGHPNILGAVGQSLAEYHPAAVGRDQRVDAV